MLSKIETNKILKIGITGGIGSGKSVISRLLKIMGYPVYDSDSWAKVLMNEDKAIRDSLSAMFGDEVYTDTGLNRSFWLKRFLIIKRIF